MSGAVYVVVCRGDERVSRAERDGGRTTRVESAESRRPEGPGRELGGHEERKKLSLISLLTAIDPQIKGSLERAAQRREPV